MGWLDRYISSGIADGDAKQSDQFTMGPGLGLAVFEVVARM